MQLNLYVSESRAELVARLSEYAERTGRPRNEIVLEALEQYLGRQQAPRKLGRFSLGEGSLGSRGELYEDRLSDPARQ